MSGLAEFLIARIAEDEAPTWELIPYTCEPGCCAPAGWVGHRCLICGTEEFGGTVEAITGIARDHDETIHRRSRVLAESEARRRIVNRWLLAESYMGSEVNDAKFSGLDEALHLLALPYADNPDYREGWRV